MSPMFEDWRLTRVESYGTGAGVRFRSKARMDRFGWGDLNFVTVQPPRRIVAAGRAGKYNRIKTYAEWDLEPASGGGTRLEFVYETEPPLPTDRIVEALSGRRRWFRRAAKKSFKNLQKILEEGSARGQRATVAGL